MAAAINRPDAAPRGGDETPGGSALRRAASRVADAVAAGLVRVAPAGALRALARAIGERDPALVTRTVTTSDRALPLDRLPPRIAGFEDLAFLFWHHPMARGVLRQDVDEAAALYRSVSRLGARHGVEIGRYAGGSTLLLAAALTAGDGGGELWSIDLAPQDDARLRAALDALGLDERVRLEVGDANLLEPPAELDFVFIDGDHSYDGARRDHLRWGAAVRVGGLVIHHDMGRARPMATGLVDLVRLRHDIEQHQRGELEVAVEAGSLVVFRRVGAGWTRFGDRR